VYFELGQGQDYVYHGKTEFEGIHQHDILALSDKQKEIYTKNTISDIFPEYYILKINNFDNIAKDGLDEWIYFLKHSKILSSFKAKGLKEANEVMDEMKLTPKQRREYSRYLETLRSNNSYADTIKAEIAFARRDAEIAAEMATKITIAQNLIAQDLPLEMIAQVTGLSLAEIKAIAEPKKE
jgi:predicted transposase/invertase (TIGR01784 family)